MSNYPLMSKYEESKAPFNEDINEPKKVKVTVSITLSKTMDVEVSDYTIDTDVDEDGNTCIIYNFSEDALKQAVESQVTLPNKAFDRLYNAVYLTEDYAARKAIDDLENWDVDDFAVVEE